MARTTVRHIDIKHLPFRLFIRLTLIFVTLFSSVLVSWILWQVFFSPSTPDVTLTNERVELLSESGVAEVEAYQKNVTFPSFPRSVFPTTDNTPLGSQ